MAVATACGNLNVTTGAAASTVAVSGLGFRPKVVLFWWSGLAATSNGARGTARNGMGAAVSASSFFAQSVFDTDAAGTAVTKNNHATDACIIELDNTAAIVGKADLASFDADGFTIEIQDAFVTDLLVSYWAIGGDDIEAAEIGSFTPAGTAPVHQTVNNAGRFKPDITFFWYGQQVGTGLDSAMLFGVARNANSQGVIYGGSNDTSTSMQTGSYCRAGECIAFNPTTYNVTPTNRAAFVSHNAAPGGFTLNWLERASTTTIRYLSIRGGRWKVGDFLTQLDTSTAIMENGFGFEPKGLFVVSAGNPATAQDASFDAHDEWSVGAASGNTARVVQQVASRNGATDSYVHLAARADALYVNSDPAQTNYTTTGLADLQTFDADGFTAIMDDADAAQAFAFYVAVGSEPAPSPPPAASSARIPRTALAARILRP